MILTISFRKGTTQDVIVITRADGSRAETTFPKKGIVPHDAVHVIVESLLGLRNAFWGQVAAGAAPEDVAALSKSGGHASAKRAAVPSPEIVELVQAERIVECFEADMWSTPSDSATFLDALRAGCEQSHVPMPAITVPQITHIRAELAALLATWSALEIGASCEMTWSSAALDQV